MSEELSEKTKLIMAIRGYETEKEKKWSNGIDFIASKEGSENKILLRVLMDDKSRTGFIGVNTIKKLIKNLDQEEYDEIIFIGKRFTNAATEELKRKNIEIVSENLMPFCRKEDFFSVIQKRVDRLCQVKCGQIPETEADCKDYSRKDDDYQCDVRRISDDALFHLNHGWRSLLSNDLIQLLSLNI